MSVPGFEKSLDGTIYRPYSPFMLLRSQFLRDDPKLQACLVSDQAHVTTGARGSHVGKIQLAVILLEKSAHIPVAELRAQLYGPGTAAAVLKYKQKRKIVNRAYETTADNIVGKMTIAKMDSELLALEQRASPGRSVCNGQPGSGPEPRAAGPHVSLNFAFTAPGTAAPQRPAASFRAARVNVLFQETDAAVALGGSVALLTGLFDRARKLMAPFNIDFSGAENGVFALVGPRIPDSEQVLSGSTASCLSVRAASERVLPGRPNTLRVIFCPFSAVEPVYGVTDAGDGFPKFCLINVRKANPDQATVLHEMIHAARPEFVIHDQDDPTSVFSGEVGRNHLPLKHAESIAHSYFANIRS